MTKKRQKTKARSRTTARQVEVFLAKEPELRDALKLFNVSMKQYTQALSHLNRPQIVTTSSSTPI